MNVIGTNTAHRTSAIAMIGALTSLIARCAAAFGARPASMPRSTFSTTTIASSTTMPIASTMPNSVSVLIVKPSKSNTPNVPTIEIGTAISGITDARHVRRNSSTTSTTSNAASTSVVITLEIERRTDTVGS
jgi:hypothetical protein